MAGHASNWFKSSSGSAKGKVFISNTAIKQFYGMTSGAQVADYKQYLHSIENKPWAADVLAELAAASTLPGGQAKFKAPAEQSNPPSIGPTPVEKGQITVTQTNGKQVTKEAITQGNLAVVETPYGHAVVHKPSGKALLYIDGDKQQVYNNFKKKYTTQSAPSPTSESAAVALMESLNGASGSWSREEVEAMGPNAQAALTAAAQGKGIKATTIQFKPTGSGTSDPVMPAAAPKALTSTAKADTPDVPGISDKLKAEFGAHVGHAAGDLKAEAFLADQLASRYKGTGKAGSKADMAMRAAYRAANPKLTISDEERSALSSYQGGGYSNINEALWAGKVTGKNGIGFDEQKARAAFETRTRASAAKLYSSPEAQATYIASEMAGLDSHISYLRKGFERALTLQKFMRRSKAPFNFTVTRSQGKDHPVYAAMLTKGVGDTFENMGFESANVNPDNSWGGQPGVQIDFRIPKGARGAYFNDIPGYSSSHPDEVEWLIPANSRWVVSERRLDTNGHLRVVLDLVSQRDITGGIIWP